MYYSLVGILALILLFIVNYGIFFRRADQQSMRALRPYRFFLYCIALFFVADILWGIFDQLNLVTACFVVTVAYFFAMALTVLSWTIFVISYLAEKGAVARILFYLGFALFLASVALLIINFFRPVFFAFDQNEYVPKIGRYLFLGTQTIMFLLTAIYAFVKVRRTDGSVRSRYVSILMFGAALAISIGFQTAYPLFPFYAIGCCIGTTIIRTFVLTNANIEYRHEIEEGKSREEQQEKELRSAQKLAYTDPLTHVKNKHAYVEDEGAYDVSIREGKMDDFAIIVFDLNDLKLTNDTKGHDAGDTLIIDSANLIREFFPEADLYRYGGDEFALVLFGDAYLFRHETLKAFDARIEQNVGTDKPVLATGMADYRRDEDNTFGAVFERADDAMYWHKRKLKQAQGAKYGVRNNIYDLFYHNKDCSLIEMLNNSSCDAILEVDLRRNTFRLLYHVAGKYLFPSELMSDFVSLYRWCFENLVHPEDRLEYERQLNPDRFFQRMAKNKIPNFEFTHLRFKVHDGSYRYVEQCVICGEENGLAHGVFRLYVFDIHNLKVRQEGKQTNRESSYEHERSPLTGLFVEATFFPQAEDLVRAKKDVPWCLIAIDIEHFRFFDEWYGREKGDELLKNIGLILAEEEKSLGGLAGYFAYDDFALLCPYDDEAIQAMYGKIRELVTSFGLSIGFLPAFGIAKIEGNARVVDAFDQANIALGRAKKDIRNRIAVYDPRFHGDEENEYRILSEFVEGMKNDEFAFYLQPQCAISTGKIVGAEALTRWIRKSGRIIPPGDYIPILEKYGFIMDLDQMLWEKVAKWLRGLIDQGVKPLPVSVNVSRADIFTLDIFKIFHDLAERYGLPHSLLEVEITESAYTETTTQIADLAKALRADGFTVLMDDFGSGYSSLNMLNTLEVDVIKLDGDFLRLSGSAYERGIRIIESVVNMTKNLALSIVVEGVETKSQSDFLQSLGCRYAQGYYFYRPMPIGQYEALLRDEKKIDRRGFRVKKNEQFRLREFLDKNIYSDSMLNNIIGPVAFYALNENESVDIVRFNEQFYEAVGINEFQERLADIRQWMPHDDPKVLVATLRKAMKDRLGGASAILRFGKPDGSMSVFHIHFYHIGKKESAELFYGSATDVSAYSELQDELKLISRLSIDSFIFVSSRSGKWVYHVASHGMSSLLGLTPEQLEKEMNDGSFARRVLRRDNLKQFMAKAQERANNKQDFVETFHVRVRRGKVIALKLEFTYVGDESNNILYVLRSSPIEE